MIASRAIVVLSREALVIDAFQPEMFHENFVPIVAELISRTRFRNGRRQTRVKDSLSASAYRATSRIFPAAIPLYRQIDNFRLGGTMTC
jgi:hypothetical protein